jgi:transcriptional regulator with XRE-family HTH domain
MTNKISVGQLLRQARSAAGLSQRTLAARAGTAQSLVSHIERGVVSPTVATLDRLLAAAGFELRTDVLPVLVKDSHMLADVERILSLSPEDRLIEMRNISRLEVSALHG